MPGPGQYQPDDMSSVGGRGYILSNNRNAGTPRMVQLRVASQLGGERNDKNNPLRIGKCPTNELIAFLI